MRTWLSNAVMIQAAAAIVLASWLFGMLWESILPWVAGVAWSSAVPLVLYFWQRRGGNGNASGGRIRRIFLVPWILFCGLVLVSVFNAAYRYTNTPHGAILVRQSFIPYIPMSVNRWHTLHLLFLISGLMVLAWALFRLARSRRHLRILLGVIFLNGVLLAVLGIAGKLFPSLTASIPLFSHTDTKPFSTFDYHNHWTAFCLMSLGAGFALGDHGWRAALREGLHKGSPLWVSLGCLALVISIPLSSSRSGMILLVVFGALVVWRAIRLKRKAESAGLSQRVMRRRRQATVVALVVLGGLVLYAGRGYLKSRFHYTEVQIEQISEGQRLEMRPYLARDTFRMALDRPVFGWGLGSFTYIFPLFAGPEFRMQLDDHYRKFPHAHDDWIQLAAEAGFLGFALFWAVPIYLVAWLRRNGRANEVSFWLSCGIALVMILACWDYPSGHLANPVMMAVCAAVAGRYAVLERLVKRGDSV